MYMCMFIYVCVYKGLASETKDPEAVARIIAALPKENKSKPRVVIITQGHILLLLTYDHFLFYLLLYIMYYSTLSPYPI